MKAPQLCGYEFLLQNSHTKQTQQYVSAKVPPLPGSLHHCHAELQLFHINTLHPVAKPDALRAWRSLAVTPPGVCQVCSISAPKTKEPGVHSNKIPSDQGKAKSWRSGVLEPAHLLPQKTLKRPDSPCLPTVVISLLDPHSHMLGLQEHLGVSELKPAIL